MKSAQELASAFLTSPDEQKRQAVALRRLAGGVKAAADRKEVSGLSDKEVKTLLDAVTVLNTLAANHTKAQKITQQRRDAQESAERAVRAAMASNFDKLASIQDKVALIAAVSSYVLRNRLVSTMDDLNYHFKECVKDLGYNLSTKVDAEHTPQHLVAEAWNKFESARAELQDKHAQEIGRLTLAVQRTQQQAANS